MSELIRTHRTISYHTCRHDPRGLRGICRRRIRQDGYARLNGIGAACVTYCVGGLNVVNAIACAYAERSPVVLLSGSPGLSERLRNPLLHHMVRDFTTQKEVFEKVTVAAVCWTIH